MPGTPETSASAPAGRARRTARGGAGRRTRRLLALLAAALLAATAAGCAVEGTGDDGGNGDTPAPEHPFTGQAAEAGPTLLTKIDNHPDARPHSGLEDADLVYAERVEGGLSRLVAVHSSTVPATAGPVRSTRESDLELVAQFGEPAFAYSGVRSALLTELAEAPLSALTPQTLPEAFFRDDSRNAPHNLYLRPEAALAATPDAGPARDIGFRFDEAVPAGGTPADEHTVAYPSASFGFTWSAEQEKWLVSFDGEPATAAGSGDRLTADTVVVQYVSMPPSRFPATPYIETVGSGEALVLRDGQRFDAEWSRPTPESGTAFTSADGGGPLPFDPGRTWIVFAEAQ
ncbi:DUF3048 domain-containing protein [Streptomyces sp. YIM 98790]|uniref:DUF3048 domain-containing protein n=1 Tax=Streptomyces sp. YIM 98790 TaxID=2689077 RepID=UPI00140DAAF9|nr:DUF3048 domain-containing protein [Streptomyces sp. YIM 98790]